MQPIYAKYNRNRFPQFQIETSIVQDSLTRYVVKKALSELAYDHIEAIHQGYQWMKEAIIDVGIKQPKVIEKKDHQIVFEFIEGKSLERFFFEAFLDGDKLQYLQCVDHYYDLLFGSFKTVKEFHLTSDNDVFLKNVDMDFIEREGVYFPHAFLDLLMDNILVTADEEYYCIDYEWIIPASIPAAFVFFRSLSNFYGFKYGEFNVEGFMPFADLMKRYGIIPYHSDQYAKIEENFQRYIVGDRLYDRRRYLKKSIFLNDLLSGVDGTQQRLIQRYEESILQLNSERKTVDNVVHQGAAERESLIEQVKAKDDQLKESIMKCDVIIPVFNAPDWVKLCVRRLISQTPDEYLNQIILVDDGSNDFTKGFLEDLAAECLKIVLVRNEKNEGFVKSINRGLSLVKAPYILLLNSDCLITKNTISKLIAHTTGGDNVGLVSPVSNHSPVVSLEMVPGYSFIDMNHLVERLFSRMSFPACTIVGNCLLITRACFEQAGFFDLVWGKGYGEESDYQFRAMKNGFEARIAIDTYVYHQSQVSFNNDPEMAALQRNNYQLFIDKWGKEYHTLYEQYKKNDPIAFMRETIKEYLQDNGCHPQYDVVYYLPGISQTIGGVHTVIDIINYLILEDIKAGLVVGPDISPFYEKMFFNYLTFESIPDFLTMSIQTAAIVATCWNTVYPCSLFASLKNIPLIYFVQGYEVAFQNGINYGSTESTYAIADDVIVTSHWLHEKLQVHFGVDSHVIPNGFDDAVFYPDPVQNTFKNVGVRTVTMILRGSVEKGDWVLMDLMKSLLREKNRKIDINMIYFSDVAFGESDSRLHPIKGPLSRYALADLLRQTDIFVDASLHEGFGMFPLEAMACGAVPVVSDSGGISQFVVDGQNGIIISEVNKVEKYVSAVKRLINDPAFYWTLKAKGSMRLKAYSLDNAFVKYATYYRNIGSVKKKEIYKKIGAFHVQNMNLNAPEYIEFFIDTGKGFNAAQSKKWKFDAKQGKIVLDLRDYPHVSAIRFDPLDNFVKIRLKQVRVFCKNGEFYDVTDYQTNALFVEDSTFMFGNDDSQVFFPLREDKEPEKIVVEVNYLLRGKDVFTELLAKCQVRMQTQDSELHVRESELQTKEFDLRVKESELHVKEGEIQQLREQLKQREGFIDLVTHSRSWKLTKPLRMLTEWLHGGVKKSS